MLCLCHYWWVSIKPLKGKTQSMIELFTFKFRKIAGFLWSFSEVVDSLSIHPIDILTGSDCPTWGTNEKCVMTGHLFKVTRQAAGEYPQSKHEPLLSQSPRSCPSRNGFWSRMELAFSSTWKTSAKGVETVVNSTYLMTNGCPKRGRT